MSLTIDEVNSFEQNAPSSTTQLNEPPEAATGTPSVSATGAPLGGTFLSSDPLPQAFDTLKVYFSGIVNDSLKPSISSTLKACNANPHVAALLATPMLFGSLVFIATFVSLTSLLIVFKSLGLFFHLVFQAIGVVASMFAWLVTILIGTALISLGATGVFVAMNVMAAFISHRVQKLYVQGGFVQPSMGREADWNQAKSGLVAILDVCKQNIQMSSTLFVQVWKVLSQVVLQMFSTIKSTSAALQQRRGPKVPEPTIIIPEQTQEVQEQEGVVAKNEGDENTEIQVHASVEGLRRRG